MKKKVLGLLMAAVLCLGLLPIGAAADEKVTTDGVNANGNIDSSGVEREGPVLISSDTTLSGKYYIVQSDMTINGNLTVDGSKDGGLVLCQGATLTVNGALIHSGGNAFYIYGQSNNGANVGELIINNSNGDGAAIRSESGSAPRLGISSGKVEIIGNGSDELVKNVELYSTKPIHEGVLDGEAKSPLEWGASSLSGGELVLDYCAHNNADYTPSGNTQHIKSCTQCGFNTGNTTLKADCGDDGYLRWKSISDTQHSKVCPCGNLFGDVIEHMIETVPTYTKQKHVTGCRECNYTEGVPQDHDWERTTGECTGCGFKPIALDKWDCSYDSLQEAMNEASKIPDGPLVTLYSKAEKNTVIDDKLVFNYPGKTITLNMNGYTLENDGNPVITVEAGTLKITGAATISQTAQSHDLVAPAIKVTGGELIFEDTLNVTGSAADSSAAPAILVENGTVTFQDTVTATGGASANTVASAIEVEGGTVTFNGAVEATSQDITETQTYGAELAPAIKVTGGTVTFKDVIAKGGYYVGGGSFNAKQAPAIKATGGKLDFQGSLTLNGGLELANADILANKLTQGTFTAELKSVNRINLTNLKACYTLLADGCAFYKYTEGTDPKDPDDLADAFHSFLSGQDVVIKNGHQHKYERSDNNTYKCDCGSYCSHNSRDNYQDADGNWIGNGKCKICGNECWHGAVSDVDWKCETCNTQMLVKIEVGGTTTYSTDFTAAMNAAGNGTKITLLKDVEQANGYSCITGDGVTVTLDLNGHTINGGYIQVGIDRNWNNYTSSTLKIIGDGSVATSGNLSVGYSAALDLSEWTGGANGKITNVGLQKNGKITPNAESLLIVSENTGTIGTLGFYSWPSSGVKTKLNGGTYGAISIVVQYNSEPFGSLLAPGYAFQYIDENGKPTGKFVEYTKTATNQGNTIYNVKVVKCPHNKLITDEVDDKTKCAYCNTKGDFVASVDGDLYTADEWDKAFAAWLNEGNSTLKLYANYTASGDVVWNGGYGANVLDLNGHTMSGAFVPSNNMYLTIKDTSEKKTGKITSILVGDSCQSLTLESGHINDLTVTNSAASFKLVNGSVAKLTVTNSTSRIILSGSGSVNELAAGDSNARIEISDEISGGSLGTYTLPKGTVLADFLFSWNTYYCTTSDVNLTASSRTEASKITFKKVPIVLGSGQQTDKTSFGGHIPFSPMMQPVPDDLTVRWYRKTADGVQFMETVTVAASGEKVETLNENAFTGVKANDELNVFCVIQADDWQTAITGYQLTVEPANISAAVVTLNETSFEYDKAEKAPTVSKVELNGITLTEGKDYAVDTITPQTNAGTYTLTITAVPNSNYTGTAKATWTIKPKTVAATVTVNGKSFTYDNGNEIKPDVTVKDGDTVISAEEYTVSYQNNINAGTATVTITDEDGGNYTVSGSTTFEIGKAAAPEATETGELSIVNNHVATYTVQLPSLPALEGNGTYGGITYGNPNFTTEDLAEGESYSAITSVSNTGLVTFTLSGSSGSKTGKIGTITVKVSTTNYEDITLTINVYATNKIVPTGAPTLSSDKLTYGEELGKITLSGAMKDGETMVPGTFAWVQPDTKPDAGSYEAEWKFTPKDTEKYLDITDTVTITVNKATPSGAPKYTAITASGKTLTDANLTTEGGTFSVPGTVKWELADTTVVTANTAYKWIFTPAAGYTDNYTTATGTITLYSVSTGGGGGSTTTNTETTTNPDGSVTKTETKSDGTVIETTTGKDGSVSKTESKTTTKSDGSTVETVTETNTNADGSKSTSKTETTTNKDGSKTESKTETKTDADGTKSETKSETKTDANGVTSGTETTKTTAPNGSTGTTTTTTENGNSKTEAETKVSEKAVEDAKKSGEAVKVPTEVKAGEDSNSAPTVKVELPKNAGETKIEIPVEDVNSGTVAVIVHPDGTEEIVKDSKPTEDGVQLTVDGSTTVKIIDNSKDFIDTRNHWSRDEVNFVVARELFNGVGNNLFGVGQPMTRGMVNTVLARLAGIDTTPKNGQKWYEVGTAWAKSQGITDGTNPEASVTREQLATLLYRFYGSPAVSGTLSFADAGEVSDYARSALLWATQNGIMNGVGNNRVAPNADAQRAQVAAMMARYLKNVG